MNLFADSWGAYALEEHSIWKDLMAQQMLLIRKYACPEYIEGLNRLKLPLDAIPDIRYVATRLENFTGWALRPVDGLISGRNFFRMLSDRIFPVVTRIRTRSEVDFYTNEAPDIFHELFGHCPLLTNKDYAKSMHRFGILSLSCNDSELLKLAKLFWATYEFGLVQTASGLKAFGAGILPSKSEIERAINNLSIPRKNLTTNTKVEVSLHGNIPQPVYYVINNINYLYNMLENFDSYL